MRMFVILNPVAGRGVGRSAADRVCELLEAAGHDTIVASTRWRGDATAIAASTPNDAVVIAIGGDGTTHEVARAVLGSERTLGVVPVGSGDDFAFALGLSRGDVDAAVDVILEGNVRSVDVGVCNGEPFLNAVGIGFDAEVAARVHDAPSWLTGVGAYLWAVFAALRDLAPVPMRVTVTGPDGAATTLHDGASLLTSVQNGPRTGGSFLFAPSASVDDGLLDVVVAGRIGRWGALTLLPKAMRGRHLEDARVVHASAMRVVIDADRPRVWHADGETFDPVVSFELRVMEAALRVFAP